MKIVQAVANLLAAYANQCHVNRMNLMQFMLVQKLPKKKKQIFKNTDEEE